MNPFANLEREFYNHVPDPTTPVLTLPAFLTTYVVLATFPLERMARFTGIHRVDRRTVRALRETAVSTSL